MNEDCPVTTCKHHAFRGKHAFCQNCPKPAEHREMGNKMMQIAKNIIPFKMDTGVKNDRDQRKNNRNKKR